MEGLESLRKPEDVAKLRGLSISEVLGLGPDGDAAKETLNGDGDAPATAEDVVAEAAEAEEAPAEAAETPATEEPTDDG